MGDDDVNYWLAGAGIRRLIAGGQEEVLAGWGSNKSPPHPQEPAGLLQG